MTTTDSVEISSDEETGHNNNHRKVNSQLIFKHKSGTVELHPQGLDCLNQGSYLKDNIVEFYSAYLLDRVCTESDSRRIHIFDSILFKQLDAIFQEKKVDGQKLAQLKYRNVDIFKKDFLVFPTCFDDHWSAIVVCFPWNVKSIEENLTGNGANTWHDNTPGIMVLDSLGVKNTKITMKVRDFLDFEWRKRLKEVKRFSHTDLADFFPELPKQKNAFDCGIYMLAYIRAFLEQPDDFYKVCRAIDPESQLILTSTVKKTLSDFDRQSIKDLILRVCSR